MRYRCVVVTCALALGVLTQPAYAAEYDAVTMRHRQPAYAAEYDTVNVTVSTEVIHDSNLFRLPDGVPPPASLGTTKRSDRIFIGSVGLRIDKPYSLQRFQLEASQTIYRYDNFSFLDFDALQYRGAWLWHVTPRINGTLSAERRQALVPFQDFNRIQRAIRTTENRVFTLDGLLAGGWHLLLGASQFQQSDSLAAVEEPSYDALSQEFGIKYVASSGSSIAAVQRYVQGDYQNRVFDPVNFIDNGFRETQSELRADWITSGKATARGRLTYVNRRHEHFPQRDFDGATGELGYFWTPTGKLQVNAGAKREVGARLESTASYRVSDTLTLGGTWQISARTSLAVRLDRIHHAYLGPVVFSPAPLREDTDHSASVYLTWTPLRNLSSRAGLQRYTRSSNTPGLDFQTNIVGVSASIAF